MGAPGVHSWDPLFSCNRAHRSGCSSPLGPRLGRCPSPPSVPTSRRGVAVTRSPRAKVGDHSPAAAQLRGALGRQARTSRFLCHLPLRWGKWGAPPAPKPPSSDGPERVTLIQAPEGVYFPHRDSGTGGAGPAQGSSRAMLSFRASHWHRDADRGLRTQVPQSPARGTRPAASVVHPWALCPDETEVPAFPQTPGRGLPSSIHTEPGGGSVPLAWQPSRTFCLQYTHYL